MASEYQKRLCEHLTDYKKKTLGIEAPGVFRHRGQDHKKGYILPENRSWLNILPQVREEIQSYVKDNPHVHLHPYFHHLNSSQAFALNLFVPFFQGGIDGSRSLLSAMCQDGHVKVGRWGVETVPIPEENTNIDATWITSLGDEWICEVKLSEAEFGPGKKDEEHKKKLTNTYAPLLRSHIPATFLEHTFFFKNYQILRNIWHMLQTGDRKLLFLMPRANKRLWKQLDNVVNGLRPEITQRISTQAVEDVLTKLRDDVRCPSHLRTYAGGLAEKYMCALDVPERRPSK